MSVPVPASDTLTGSAGPAHTDPSLIRDRYGDPEAAELADLNEVLEVQLRHRSIRTFSTEPVSDETLRSLVAAAQSAPTSSNLQTWSVVAVRDANRRQQLAQLAGGQDFITQAPLFLVWLADLGRAREIVASADRPAEGADYLESSLVGVIDTALAAQNAVVAAESLGLGTVFVGAVRNDPEGVAQVLGLPRHTIAVAGLAVGHPDPATTAQVKPRLPASVVLHHDIYDSAGQQEQVAAYDARIASFYAAQGIERSWTPAVLRRFADATALHGRDRLSEAFANRGLSLR